MGKPAIIVSKAGSVLYMRDAIRRSSPVGEQGETEGMLRYLGSRDDLRVVYFGPMRGDPPANVTYVEPAFDEFDVHELMPDKEHTAFLETSTRRLREALGDDVPVAMVQVCGYASTMSIAENPRRVQVQACGMRYVAPALHALHSLKVPRVCVNNDPRSYPRDQEMTLCWPEVRPAAMLSQRTGEFPRRVGGTDYIVREVHAWPENWWLVGYDPPAYSLLDRPNPCLVVAHAHVTDGCKAPKRADVWTALLDGYDEPYEIYGRGWEFMDGTVGDAWKGVVRPNEVRKLLTQAVCGPVVAVVTGFYTSKLSMYVAHGCAPILYGRGEPHTYDVDGHYLHLDDPRRVCSASDLRRVVRVMHDPVNRTTYLDHIRAKMQPDFKMLDRCIGDLCNGRDVNDMSWWKEYGGYRIA